MVGKITVEELKKYVLPYKGAFDKSVILNSNVGEDTAIVSFKEAYLALKVDPISCAVEQIGYLAVNINANDIVTRGAIPKWFLPIIILPTTATSETVESIMIQIDKAAKELNIAIVGGHTEFIDGLTHPIVAAAMIGVIEGDKYITTSGAKVGDRVILTKGAGVEATAILATDLENEVKEIFGPDFLSKAKSFLNKISVVKDALTALKAGKVNSMHDCTEGGVVTALNEVAEASGHGIKIWEEKIYVAPETNKLCAHYGLDPLQIVSSGSLIITAPPGEAEKIVNALSDMGIRANIIGEIVDRKFGHKLIKKSGKVTDLPMPEVDQLWKFFDRITKFNSKLISEKYENVDKKTS